MHDKHNIPTPLQAGAQVGRLYKNGSIPTPTEELDARRNLASAHLYKAARTLLSETRGLDPIRAAHLVGFILGESGVKYDAVTLIEKAVREAVSAAQAEEA